MKKGNKIVFFLSPLFGSLYMVSEKFAFDFILYDIGIFEVSTSVFFLIIEAKIKL